MKNVVDPFTDTLGLPSKVIKARFKNLVNNPDKSKISCIDQNTGDMIDVSENISVAYFWEYLSGEIRRISPDYSELADKLDAYIKSNNIVDVENSKRVYDTILENVSQDPQLVALIGAIKTVFNETRARPMREFDLYLSPEEHSIMSAANIDWLKNNKISIETLNDPELVISKAREANISVKQYVDNLRNKLWNDKHVLLKIADLQLADFPTQVKKLYTSKTFLSNNKKVRKKELLAVEQAVKISLVDKYRNTKGEMSISRPLVDLKVGDILHVYKSIRTKLKL